jgi:hypothetical protein
LLRRFSSGTDLANWALSLRVPECLPLIDPNTSSGATGELRLSFASTEATDTFTMTVTLVVGFSGPLGFRVQHSE